MKHIILMPEVSAHAMGTSGWYIRRTCACIALRLCASSHNAVLLMGVSTMHPMSNMRMPIAVLMAA